MEGELRPGEELPVEIHRDIRVENGIGYGVIGADLHVWGDGVPLYLLENWHDTPVPDPEWLRELPSRLLNARYEVVEFTGRDAELAALHEWRRGSAQLAIRLLHGPGGAGKTRLAARFARESAAENWKVITATLGPGTLLPGLGSQDLRPGTADGVLLIIDYADQWPASYLTRLLSAKLFRRHPRRRTRILLVARTRDSWPGLQYRLRVEQPSFSSQPLGPLPDDREQRGAMFAAAARSFAAHYQRPDLAGLEPAAGLDGAEFGLTLAVHMAALVAVDAGAAGRPPPSGAAADMASLTMYLLGREHAHWEQVHGDGTHELVPGERAVQTPPGTLHRAVFCAALTGAVDRGAGLATLEYLPTGIAAPEQVLADHALCYPPDDPAKVLAPLYPDRLAEDFIALTIAGHAADYPAQDWAVGYAYAILGRLIDVDLPPGSPAFARLSVSGQRPLLFLASAAQRWPHVWTACLSPVLRLFPRYAIAGGSAVLSAVARIGAEAGSGISGDVAEVLAKVEALFPDGPDFDLDIGMADVTGRIAARSLAAGDDPELTARCLDAHAMRCNGAGRYADAISAAREAVGTRRSRAQARPGGRGDLSGSLSILGHALSGAGQDAEALACASEALGIERQLADAGGGGSRLAVALHNAAVMLAANGRLAEAVRLQEQSVAIRRSQAADDPAEASLFVTALGSLAARYVTLGRHQDAIAVEREALAVSRGLADANPGGHLPDLALTVGNLGIALDASHPADGLAHAREAAALFRRLARASPARYSESLASALFNMARSLAYAGNLDEAIAAAAEAADIFRSLAGELPGAHLPSLAEALNFLGKRLAEAGQSADALSAAREAVAIYRGLRDAGSGGLPAQEAAALSDLCALVAMSGDSSAALPLAQEAVLVSEPLAATGIATDLRVRAYARNNLTVTLLRLGEFAEAVTAARDTVGAFESLPAPVSEKDSQGLRAARLNLALAEGKMRRAAARRWLRHLRRW